MLTVQELSERDFPNRSWERELLNPLVGNTMLELGNKVKGELVYKDVFEGLGMVHVSIDMNGLNDALPIDLRQPFDLGTFDMITNFGTTEHVSVNDYAGQVACWKNLLDAMHVGSVLVSITPKPRAQRWTRHGRWYPTVEFFYNLAEVNGLEVERAYTDASLVYARLTRLSEKEFVMPSEGMYINTNDLKMAGCS